MNGPKKGEAYKLIKETTKTIEFRALEKGVAVKVKIGQNVPDGIVTDQGRLRQVLLNFLSNAEKFTSEGHIEVYVKLIERNGQKCRLSFSVSDTGIGIPEEKFLTIFESFTQADEGTYKKFGGTGLGLSISKKLVELLGGEIGVKSIEGIGSSFWFELPVEISDIKIEPTDPQLNIKRKDLRGMRILLVEDDRMNQNVMSQILRKWNARVEISENGRIALEALKKDFFDLILMDVHMPEMDGFEISEIIRDPNSSVLDHQVPIIAMTADVSHETRVKVMNTGMNGFIAKPSDPDVLFQKIVEHNQNMVSKDEKTSSQILPNKAILSYEVREMKSEVQAALRELFDDNTAAAISLIGNFIRQIPPTLDRVNEYLELEKDEKAAMALHRIKPGFLYLGFTSTAAKIEELQEVIRKAKDPGNIRQHMQKVEKDIKTIIQVLREILIEMESNEFDEIRQRTKEP